MTTRKTYEMKKALALRVQQSGDPGCNAPMKDLMRLSLATLRGLLGSATQHDDAHPAAR